MEINELRYGNWIMSKSSSIPFEVYIGDFEPIFDNPEHYFGMPITKEWLLKFGFTESNLDVDNTWLNLRYRFLNFASDESVNFEKVYLTINKMEVVCKHVHQLQNLYFALTGEELTCKS